MELQDIYVVAHEAHVLLDLVLDILRKNCFKKKHHHQLTLTFPQPGRYPKVPQAVERQKSTIQLCVIIKQHKRVQVVILLQNMDEAEILINLLLNND